MKKATYNFHNIAQVVAALADINSYQYKKGKIKAVTTNQIDETPRVNESRQVRRARIRAEDKTRYQKHKKHFDRNGFPR